MEVICQEHFTTESTTIDNAFAAILNADSVFIKSKNAEIDGIKYRNTEYCQLTKPVYKKWCLEVTKHYVIFKEK